MLQRLNDFLYDKFGLNRVTLDLQVLINSREHRKDENIDDDFEYIQ